MPGRGRDERLMERTKAEVLAELVALQRRMDELGATLSDDERAALPWSGGGTRADRALGALASMGEATREATDDEALLRAVCARVVGQGYAAAWAALLDDADRLQPAQMLADPVAPTAIAVEHDEAAAAEAMRACAPVITRPGDGGSTRLSLPLLVDRRAIGVLVVHARERDAFEAREVTLLGILADGVARAAAMLRARGERRRAEARLTEVLDAAGMIAWSQTLPDGRITHLTRASEALLGRSAESLQRASDPWAEIVHPEDRAAFAAGIAGAEESGRAELDARVTLPDGAIRWLHFSMKIRRVAGEGSPRRLDGVAADVTEQRRHEHALRMSQRFLQAVLDSLGSQIAVLDADARVIAVNAAWARFAEESGLADPEGGVGQSYFEVCGAGGGLEPQTVPVAEQGVRLVLAGTSPAFAMEYPSHQGASPRWFALRVTPIPSGAGPGRAVVAHLNVSERYLAAEALRRSEERFRRIIDGGWDVVALTSAGGRVEYMSGSVARVLGTPAYALLGRRVRDIVHSDDAPVADGVLREVLSYAGCARTYEARFRHQDGRVVWMEVTAVNLLDQPAVGAIVINARDVTARKRAEVALYGLNAELERRVAECTAELADLYDNAPCGYHSLTPDGAVVRVNGTELSWLGYTRDELVGKRYMDLLVPEARPAFVAALSTLAKEGRVSDLECEILRKDGTAMPAVLNLTAATDVEGRTALSRVTVVDNTARTRMERELRRANEALETASRAKDEFLAAMSHELRTPLNAVLGLSEALEEEVYGALSDKQRVTVRRIGESGRHLLALINDILDLSKIEAGRVELDLAPLSVDDVCRASVRLVLEAAQKKRLALSLRIRDGFSTVVADERRLKQILVNLLSNAVKFTPEGGQVGLEAALDREHRAMRFTVWDTGIGIAERDLGRLFLPFVQLDSKLSRQHAGTGLGLALVRRLVALHGGHVDVESTPAKGSRFTVLLPAAAEGVPVEDDAPPPPSPGRVSRALVVEDSATAAEHLARYLVESNIDLVVHSDGCGVIERVVAEDPDVVFLDVLLPEEIGWDILDALKKDPRTRHVPVVIVSILDHPPHRLAAEPDDYIVKPVTRERLRAVLSRLHADPTRSRRGPAKVLLAEDDETNVATVSDFLRARGYEIFVARNGIEAVSLARSIEPDVVIMDIQMPLLDGLSATEELRASPSAAVRSVPVIALTALAMAGDRERCLAAGADDYLTKPVSLKELAGIVEARINSRRS